MSQYQFAGVINTDNVYIRSGAGENDYPVLKLNRNDRVVVVGSKFDWLKILPPEGTFCLVGKAWVNKRGDGSIGRVRDDAPNAVNVRIGSTLNPIMMRVAMQLKGGEDVKILGDQDEYFKIAPPPGAFVYVHKRFVDPVQRVDVSTENGTTEVKPSDTVKIDPTPALPDVEPPRGASPEAPGGVAGGRETPPTTAPAPSATAKAQVDFDQLEARFEDAGKLPIEQQPLDELLSGYKSVAGNKELPSSILQTAELRIRGLNIRKEALAQYLEVKKMQTDMAEKVMPLEAEEDEIAQRLKETQVTRYTAVGTLRSSAIPFNGRPLYRLTDPASGRTVIYVLSNDPTIAKNEGAFVGIRGTITDDAARRIKYIEPTAVETVQPSALAEGKVVSTLTPASLMPTAAGE
jgi:hypothetical protein